MDHGYHYRPFPSVEAAWFWFIKAYQARIDGARVTGGIGSAERPCEPVDILKILDGLYRNRVLDMDHILVLRHYGRKQKSPNSNKFKQRHAHTLWHEAIRVIEPILIKKGIVESNVKKLIARG